MTLRIKGKKEKVPEIELTEDPHAVYVQIDGNNIADFCKDGTFVFWGKTSQRKFEDRWDE